MLQWLQRPKSRGHLFSLIQVRFGCLECWLIDHLDDRDFACVIDSVVFQIGHNPIGRWQCGWWAVSFLLN